MGADDPVLTRASDYARSIQWIRVARMFWPIGVEQLWKHRERDEWAVSLDNRTYHNFVRISPDRVSAWKREFDL